MTGPQQGGPQGFDPTQRPATPSAPFGQPAGQPQPSPGQPPLPGQPVPGQGQPGPPGYGPPRPGSAYVPGQPAQPGQPPRAQPNFPGQFGPQGYPPAGYGGYNPYSYPPPAKPRRTGLLIGIIVAAVVLIGGGVTTWLLLSGGNDPQDVANQYATSAQSNDVAGVKETVCAADQAFYNQNPTFFQQISGSTVTAGEVTENDSSGSVVMTVTYQGQTVSNSSLPIYKNDNDNWLICESGALTSADQDR